MGRSFTPKYRIETGSDKQGWVTYAAWRCEYGKPDASRLEAYRVKLNESFLPGGVNSHCVGSAGQVLYFSNLRVVEQKTGRVVAVAWGPMFELIC